MTNPAKYLSNLFSILAKKFLGTTMDERMGLRTGLLRLDKTIRGLHPGKIYIVGARTGDGKTSFCTTIAAGLITAHPNNAVLMISTELDEQEIMLQVAEAYSGGIPVYPNNRRSSESEIRRLDASLTEISGSEETGHFQVLYEKSVTLDWIKQAVKAIQPEDGKQSVLIIDQASRIRRDDADGRRQYNIATEDMLNGLEQIIKPANVSLILVSHLNRGAEGNKLRLLSHLKHSGAFEEFAHCVMLLEKCEGNGQRPTGGGGFVHHDGIIHVAKNRHGVTGKIKCEFHGESHHWTEKEER